MQIIGISGVARSGKDTLAKCLKIKLGEKGKVATIRSLAAPLKSHLKDFIFDNFGIDVFNCTDEDKAIIRPILVAYGGAKRKQTKGKFWTGLMDEEILRLKGEGFDTVIIPDIRYSDPKYDEDELTWLKSKEESILFHVERILDDGSIVKAPNSDEEENDPRIKEGADYEITWESQSLESCLELINIKRFKL